MDQPVGLVEAQVIKQEHNLVVLQQPDRDLGVVIPEAPAETEMAEQGEAEQVHKVLTVVKPAEVAAELQL
jgi:hypothetical protein